MKKIYEKPFMAVTRFDNADSTNSILTKSSQGISEKRQGGLTKITYGELK
jgi:hypothetical protein